MTTPENPMAFPLTPTEAIAAMVSRWDAPDGSGIPFKGEIISDDGCMCAQGQALHFIAGLTPDELRVIEQRDADTKTMEIFGISRAHAILLRQVNDGQPGAPSVVLTEPERVLGPEAQTVLAFWRHLDTMAEKDLAAAGAAAWAAAGDAAWAAAGAAAGAAAWAAAGDAAGAAAWAAAGATSEIQGASVMRERGRSFYFLPMFGFATPEDVLAARSAGEGK